MNALTRTLLLASASFVARSASADVLVVDENAVGGYGGTGVRACAAGSAAWLLDAPVHTSPNGQVTLGRPRAFVVVDAAL